jgi:F-type H+-transporting ATPase subunit b
MQKLLEILAQLGLDHTVWIQLVFFIISYVFVSQFLFRPYMRNLAYRKKNTSGALDEAGKLATVTESLAMDFQGRMKKQNETAENAYGKLRAEGLLEEEKLLTAARNQATKVVEETKEKISTEIARTKEELRAQIPQLSTLIASRLLGREI